MSLEYKLNESNSRLNELMVEKESFEVKVMTFTSDLEKYELQSFTSGSKKTGNKN